MDGSSTMPDNADEFLRKANEDLYLVGLAIRDSNVAPWIIGFHCQQAVEKSLKAVLVRKGIHFQKIHDLFRLIQLFSDAGIQLPPWSGTVDVLNPFAVEARYNDLLPTDFDPHEARRLAAEVRDWAHAELAASETTKGHVLNNLDAEDTPSS